MTMFVDLTETDSWPKKFDLTVEPGEIDLDLVDFRLKGPVRANGEIEKHAAWFEVEGRIECEAEIDCSRCLEPIGRPIAIPFSIRLLQTESLSEAAEKAIDKSELDSSILNGTQVDITEIIREQILLDVPDQIFCKEDCRGLCPKCGANRNLIDCKCEDDETDPRWAALQNLK